MQCICKVLAMRAKVAPVNVIYVATFLLRRPHMKRLKVWRICRMTIFTRFRHNFVNPLFVESKIM